MSSATFLVGHALDRLRDLPAGSVDMVLTSPPFLALRSYLPADHPDKDKEIGGEKTPGEFIDSLLDVTEELRRVLTPHGSICVELGDTYAGSGGAGGDYNEGGLREGQPAFVGSARTAEGARLGVDGRNPGNTSRGTPARRTSRSGPDRKYNRGHAEMPETGGDEWPLERSLCLVPELYRVSLVYGFNPLTGRKTPVWRARNVVRWVRPNPPVGFLGDKFRPGTSDIVIACADRRYFDLDAVRHHNPRANEASRTRAQMNRGNPGYHTEGSQENAAQNQNGAPPLDWWEIPPTSYDGAHYATFPESLCVKPILAMCPLKVCTLCGKPSQRITDDNKVTIGWTDCGHDAWRNGVVLDPFAGTGTVGAVAVGNGRDAILIDLDERNAWLARERVGMFLQIEQRKGGLDEHIHAVSVAD